jgi:hypothetical protein
MGPDDPAPALVHALAAERTIAFAAIGTRHVIGLVDAHNLPGLTGATADGSTWQVSQGTLQVPPPPPEDARQASV